MYKGVITARRGEINEILCTLRERWVCLCARAQCVDAYVYVCMLSIYACIGITILFVTCVPCPCLLRFYRNVP